MSQTYDFSEPFVIKIVALLLRDATFAESTFGLIKPEYVENVALAYLTQIGNQFFEKYRCTPTKASLIELIRTDRANHKIRDDLLIEIKDKLVQIFKADLSDRDFAIEQSAAFARNKAVSAAILKSVNHLQLGEYDKIEEELRAALLVGATDCTDYDFFAEADNRAEIRKEQLKGNIQATGISTGLIEIDNRLHHKGFGREELSVWMGPAKVGKSMAMTHTAISAVLTGKNVLYVTLENSLDVTSERLDAMLTSTPTSQLKQNALSVASKIDQLRKQGRLGKLMIHSYPTGTWRPSDCHRLIQHYKASSLLFDEVVVDYLDIMAPDHRSKDPIENSKNIWQDMRAIAQREHLAMVTATQTNREGFKAAVAGATHVSEDINKIRIADLVISINRDESEKRDNKARLYMAAGRNQEDGITIEVKQDLARAKFIEQVLSIS